MPLSEGSGRSFLKNGSRVDLFGGVDIATHIRFFPANSLTRATSVQHELATHRRLWFAKIVIGIQIKELADPPAFVFARMILTSCGAC